MPVITPATGRAISSFGNAMAAEMGAVVAAARGGYLRRLGAMIAADADAMTGLTTAEQGKVLNERREEILKLVKALHVYSEEAA